MTKLIYSLFQKSFTALDTTAMYEYVAAPDLGAVDMGGTTTDWPAEATLHCRRGHGSVVTFRTLVVVVESISW